MEGGSVLGSPTLEIGSWFYGGWKRIGLPYLRDRLSNSIIQNSYYYADESPIFIAGATLLSTLSSMNLGMVDVIME